MSARNYPIACPKCGAPPNAQCRSVTRGRLSDTHVGRIAALRAFEDEWRWSGGVLRAVSGGAETNKEPRE